MIARRFWAVAGMGLASVAAMQAAPPSVTITATSPESPASLAAQEALYVRIAYRTDQPLHFQAAGYFHGQKRERHTFNPSPLYPVGAGEAVAWLAADPGAQIDEIRVIVTDGKWRELLAVPVAIQAAWHASVKRNVPATWAKTLSDAQQQAVQADLSHLSDTSDGWWDTMVTWLLPAVFLSVPGYPILQLYAFVRLRGRRRLLAALPLTFMLPTYGFCAYALSQDSNLWPMPAIGLSPIALLIVTGMLIFNRRRPISQPVGEAPV